MGKPFCYKLSRYLKLLAALLLSVVFPAVVFSASPLSSQEKHGKHVYSKTTSPSGKEIKAFVGVASLEAPGAAMACANCHGNDGKGRPEGGITPSNITWKELNKSYGVRHASGREHPAYTEETLARAIAKGIDPAGNKLDPAMPHYSMPEEDLAALVAYLKRLGTELDPGISESAIRIGTILPSDGPGGAWETPWRRPFKGASPKSTVGEESIAVAWISWWPGEGLR
jgi:cytochrome c553